MQHVIVGAGAAGIVAAEALRRHDPKSRVIVIGDEPEPPYARMAIPYYLVGQIGEDGTHVRSDAGHFEAAGVDVRRARVSAVDPAADNVILDDGSRLDYDRLLIASGSSAVKPPIPGIDLPNVVNCWTLEDARKIAAVCHPGHSAVLMGAGFIGCIILEALARSGVGLSVVEAGNRMVPRMMTETAGGMIKQWCERQGVAVHTSARVTAIEETGEPVDRLPFDANRLRVGLETGETLDADIVIAATGVRPNVGFLEGSGIKVDTGILVDECFRTNLPKVFAAGDVCEGYDFSTGLRAVHAIQPTATEHGACAAANMLGTRLAYQGSINMNVLDTLGLISTSFGRWMGSDGGDGTELADPDNFKYLNLQFEDDVMVGASSLGMTDHVGVLRGLIQSKTRLHGWKKRLLDDPTQFMRAYLDCHQTVPARPLAG
jgi:NAD(P)H-nitrite reductase large subunit